MSKERLATINKWLIVALVILQPIFDMIRKNIVHDIQIVGVSLFEIVNIILIILSIGISIYLYRNKKHFKKFLLIVPLFLIYCIIHYINISNFNLSVYENASPNFFIETYYLFRMFMVPLLLLISIYYSGIKKDSLVRVIEIMAFIISISIVIPNVFKFGYSAYDVENYAHKNIFDWFFFESKSFYDYYNITSRGLFNSGNQMASILFMICPIVMYQAFEKRSIFNYVLLILTSIAMLMVGTKVANIGIILIFVLFILLYYFFVIVKKSRKSIKPIIYIFVITLVLFCFSPVSHNIRFRIKNGNGRSEVQSVEDKISQSSPTIEDPSQNSTDPDVSDKTLNKYSLYGEIREYDCNNLSLEQIDRIIYFYDNYSSFIGLSTFITENYNVDKHVIFWCDYIVNYNSSNYRELKTSIYKNIQNENNNKFDKLLGLGHTLNYIYTEEDYTYQYYTYGIIGFVVLLGPYFAIIIYLAFNILKVYKKKFNFENIVYLMAPSMILVIAYFSGHVFETTMTLITLSAILGFNLINYKSDSNNKKKVLFIASTGGHLSELMQLQSIYEDYDYRLITEKTNSTKGLNNKFKNRVGYLVFGSKDHKFSYLFKFTYNCFKSLFMYLTFNPSVIVTTGTHTAVPMCYIGKFFGSKIIFIETFANSKTKTLSGRLVYPIADEFIVQWESMLKLYPKATYGGWIY